MKKDANCGYSLFVKFRQVNRTNPTRIVMLSLLISLFKWLIQIPLSIKQVNRTNPTRCVEQVREQRRRWGARRCCRRAYWRWRRWWSLSGSGPSPSRKCLALTPSGSSGSPGSSCPTGSTSIGTSRSGSRQCQIGEPPASLRIAILIGSTSIPFLIYLALLLDF